MRKEPLWTRTVMCLWKLLQMKIKFIVQFFGTEKVFRVLASHFYFIFPAYMHEVRSGTGLSNKLAWHVQVHAMANKAEPDEEI
jgi:hypothetical protein